MKKSSTHFFFKKYTKSQQKGILILFFILLSVVAYNYIQFNYITEEVTTLETNTDLVKRVTTSIDSVRLARQLAMQTKPQSIKINFISEYNAYKIGLSPAEYEAVIEYNKSGNWINSKEILSKVTQIPEKKLDSINTFLIYPQYKTNYNNKSTKKPTTTKPKLDINKATASQLKEINGIGEVLSDRILKYRAKLGGFRAEFQLREVYGVKLEVYTKLTEAFEVKNKTSFTKVDLKNASIIQLSEIPYFDYELARNIKRFVDLREGDVSIDDLIKINDFPTSKVEGIKLYLEIID